MLERDEIDAIVVSLTVEGEQAVFVLLAADGSINRLGTGTMEVDRTLYMGLTDPELFPLLRDKVTPELLAWCGKNLKDPNLQGKLCELKVIFRKADGQEAFTGWNYGADSLGPPQEVCDFVEEALRSTEPWFQHQKTRSPA